MLKQKLVSKTCTSYRYFIMQLMISSALFCVCIFYKHCVVPENIHTPPPTDGQWKFLGGGGAKR